MNRFIVFEGIDRCGKRTQLELTQRWLLSRGCLVQTGSEPNDKTSPVGIYIRRILKKEVPSPGFYRLQYLFTLDRAQDIVCLIQPALDNGHFVLWERFAHSTLAYGMLEGDPERYLKLQYDVIGPFMIWPRLTLVFDISADEAIRRMEGLGEAELFEKQETLERVRQNYLTLAKKWPASSVGEMIVLDAMRPPQEIFEEVKNLLQERIGF
ncbi:MAG: dTMP kinase [Parcubacteria group bacterium]|nr:dTMP kinase [Parcubacteria group bacterium]